MRADALLDTGDMDGAATWRKIIKAIEVLPGDRTGWGAALIASFSPMSVFLLITSALHPIADIIQNWCFVRF